MLCCVVCVVVVVVLLVVVVSVCVLRHTEKSGKTRVWIQKRRVYIQDVPECTGTTRTCVSTCARGARTHGCVLFEHTGTFRLDTRAAGGHRQFCSQAFGHMVLSRAAEVHPRNFWIFPIFEFENGSRTTCSRFLHSFALPDKAFQFRQS